MEQQDGGTVAQLCHYLASRPDVIEGSFTQTPPPLSPFSGDSDVSDNVVRGKKEDYPTIADGEVPDNNFPRDIPRQNST